MIDCVLVLRERDGYLCDRMQRDSISGRILVATSAIICAVVFLNQRALAKEHEWLNWQAPNPCPSAEEIETRLEAWLGSPLVFEKELTVKATVEPEQTGWSVLIHLSYGEDVGQREVVLDSCSEAGDFVALTVALAVERQLQTPGDSVIPPSLAVGAANAHSSLATDSSTPSQPESTTGNATPRQDVELSETPPSEAAFPLVAASSPAPELLEPSAPEDATAHTPPPTDKNSSDTLADPAPSPSSNSDPSWFLSTSLAASWGPLPTLSLGPALDAGLRLDSWQLSLGAFYFPGGSYELSDAKNNVHMSLIGGTTQLCYHLSLGRLRGGPCASVQIGALPAQEELTGEIRSPRGGSALWLAVLPGGEASFEVTRHLEVFLGAEALLPLLRPEFALAGSSTTLFRSGPGFQGRLGVKFFF